MTKSRRFTQEQIIAYYDRFGARQDQQGCYEDIALTELIRYGRFEQAERVVEFGCGTGRFAERLLADYLPPQATYWGCDVSATMVNLAKQRLLPFKQRSTVWKSQEWEQLPLPEASADRFVSTYVLDILPTDEIATVIEEARRALKPGGLICLASLTNGKQGFSKLVTTLWKLSFALKPSLVGGCRPVELQSFLPAGDWETLHRSVVVGRGISSEVVVASRSSFPYP